MKTIIWSLLILGYVFHTHVIAQSNTEHFGTLVLQKKEKKVFNSRVDRDSSSVIYIDTLIMQDKSSLQFYGKKDVTLKVKHAIIGKQAVITGLGAQNNASNFDITINFQKLGSLYVLARGQDAINGTRTLPNGDAGNITITYDTLGIAPQQNNKKGKNYLVTDASPGGLRVNPTSDLNNIYSMIARAPVGLLGLPQGQIYSGSPGKDGKVAVKSN